MAAADDDKEQPSKDELRKAVEDLKKKDLEGDHGRMPVDTSLGHPESKEGRPEELLPPDDDEN